ncbi:MULTISPECIES: TetR/AcrR family transcriptional regulator [Limnobacter]|uniref:HTH tetR-type domain-containing protein n=1 Tax=Limnobacter litoralis TaxID=481366 RepID=A0ABQ5YNT4_9BURK|nr:MULTISPECIES: TetR/AcrR family transcriptional regulator [Limnobacter]GLR25450.1 hypothetical protein GCM10007875_05380 [Limnobacter litoralis]
MTEAIRKSGKRHYLDKDARKKQLIEQAADLVEGKGWAVLNMSALADHAKVSRQLVYQHFPNLDGLLVETARHIFMETMMMSQAAIMGHQGNIRDAVRAAGMVSLDLPQGRGDALWQLIAGMNYGSEALEKLRMRIRELILSLWVPLFQKTYEMEETSARSLVWMLIIAFWGLRQMVRDGMVSREQAMDEMDRVVKAVL